MPTFRITDPETGRTVRVTGDSMPTEAEVLEIFAALPGPVPSASMPKIDIDARRKEAVAELAQEGGAFSDFANAFALGALNLQRGIGLIDDSGRESEQLLLEALKEKSPVSATTGEVLGESAPFIGLGVGAGAIPTFAGRVAAAGAIGAAEGGLSARGRGGDVAESATATGSVAAGLEAVLPVAGRIVGSIGRRLFGRAPAGPVFDAAGNISEEGAAILNKAGVSPEDLGASARKVMVKESGLDPAEVARKAFLESQGVRPTKAQITRDVDDFVDQQELAKKSGALRSALDQQQAVAAEAFDTGMFKAVGENVSASSSISEALVGKAEKLNNEIKQLYTQARESGSGVVKPVRLVEKLKRNISSDKLSGGALSAIKGDLINKNVIDKNFNIVGTLSPGDAEELRVFMNSTFDPMQGFRNSKVSELKESLDLDVVSDAGEDAFKKAREAYKGFKRGLQRKTVSDFDKSKKNLVLDVLENRIDPDDMIPKVITSSKFNAADVKQLKNYLKDAPGGAEAFNDLRSDTLLHLRDKAFSGPIDKDGFQALNHNALQKEINKIKKPKLDALFTKEEQKFLTDIVKVGKLIQPVRGTALGKGPSAAAIESGINKLINRIPLVGDAIDAVKITRGANKQILAKPSKVKNPKQPLTSTTPISTGIAAGITDEGQQNDN